MVAEGGGKMISAKFVNKIQLFIHSKNRLTFLRFFFCIISIVQFLFVLDPDLHIFT